MRPPRHLTLVLACLLLTVAARGPAATQPGAQSQLVFFGTYTGAKSKGIYVSRLESRRRHTLDARAGG